MTVQMWVLAQIWKENIGGKVFSLRSIIVVIELDICEELLTNISGIPYMAHHG